MHPPNHSQEKKLRRYYLQKTTKTLPGCTTKLYLDLRLWPIWYGRRGTVSEINDRLLPPTYERITVLINLGMGDTIDLHRNLAWPKMNENFDGVLKASRRDHQGGTTGTGGAKGPTTNASSNVTASSSDTGPDMDSKGREERRQQNKERKRRDM